MNDIRFIPLSEGQWVKRSPLGFALIDVEDFSVISKFAWSKNWCGYACRRFRENGHQKSVKMHRLILNAPQGMEVDHKNGIVFDNRKSNLRLCDRFGNTRNSRKLKIGTSRYKGVYFDKFRGKWVARIRENCRVIFLGRFESEKEAAKVYNTKAATIYGEFACLNQV